MLKSSKSNFLLSLVEKKKQIGLAYTDISTGDIWFTEITNFDDLLNEIERIAPSEVVVIESSNLPDLSKYLVNPVSQKEFSYFEIVKQLRDFYSVHSLEGVGLVEDSVATEAICLLFNYISETQFELPKHIKIPKKYTIYDSMILDSVTLNSLNLIEGEKNQTTLFDTINECLTAMGTRFLYFSILHPSINKAEIDKRLNYVEFYLSDYKKLTTTRTYLKGISDVDRILGRLGGKRSYPRDLLSLKDSIDQVELLFNSGLLIHKGLDKGELKQLKDISGRIEKTIRHNPSNDFSKGGYIKKGASAEFDDAYILSSEGEKMLTDYEKKLAEEYNIGTLKIKRNKVWGHYIEITKKYAEKVPKEFIHRQTLVSALRYTTKELMSLERKILNAEESIISIELSIYNELVNYLVEYFSLIQKMSEEVAFTDLFSSFAYIASTRNYIKPLLLSSKEKKININGGRHPVVSEVLKEKFIANDTCMDSDSYVHVITGPNMSGKSTYLRQVALIIIMAQIGSYVPAEVCEFTICDRIFTRIGASDDITSGKSTFMVEMTEVSNILKNATSKSLILLDEVGRGTSTYDGVSLAWAITKYIATEIRAFTLFATHYHELVELKQYCKGIENYTVSVLESEDKKEVTFLYKIEKGSTDQSYGVYVARIAGIPNQVLLEAERILSGFEQKKLFSQGVTKKELQPSPNPTSLFKSVTDPKLVAIRQKLKSINIDEMTPIQALAFLAELIDMDRSS